MQPSDPEPGFVQAYRLFVATSIVFWMVIGPILLVFEVAENPTLSAEEVASIPRIANLSLPNIAPVLAVEFVLFALLLLPQAPRRLGRSFVPLTLGIGLAPLVAGYYWWPSANPLQTPWVMFFFVMLILIAWQYRFRYVMGFVLLLSAFESAVSATPPNTPWTAEAGWYFLQAAMMLLVGYVTATFVTVQREQRTALAEAYEQQAAATARLQRQAATLEELTTVRERNRLARELHDTLAHSLSAVAVQLEAVDSLWEGQPAKARRLLQQANEVARTGLTEARRALQALRASPLEDLGLALAVQELAESAAQRAGARLEAHLAEGADDGLPAAVEQGVYRIAQEALENVVRHAEAMHIVLRLEREAGKLVLTIEDDGQGIDPAALDAREAEAGDRLGIVGMQERAALIRGSLEIAGRPGEGTRVRLGVPLS